MFIKTTKAKDYEYIKLVESYRDEKNVTRHNVLFNFGRADLIKNNKSFINMVKKLCEIAEVGITGTSELDCSEAEMLRYGYLPYLKLWNELGISNCLKRLVGDTKCTYEIEETAFLMAVQHLLQPKSKLATYEHQNKYIGLKQAELHHMYRSLDRLGEWKEQIENDLFLENYTRVGNKVDVVFYDVTTFAFESVIADELRSFGFSKDCKFNEVQVVMGLLIDTNGFPIGYELVPRQHVRRKDDARRARQHTEAIRNQQGSDCRRQGTEQQKQLEPDKGSRIRIYSRKQDQVDERGNDGKDI